YSPPEPSFTSSEDEYIKADRDDNGIPDIFCTSISDKEKLDICYLDNDEDGNIDLIVMDSNGDGTPDCRVYDKDGDGQFEYFIIDTDFDEVFDTVAIDSDLNGEPDKFAEYSE
ncbi:uncharacterized protein METZ01_LOCUS373424, partial [marine metagenome]